MTTTTTTPTQPFVSVAAGGTATAGPNGASGSGRVSASVNLPDDSVPPGTTAPITVPPPVGDAVTQACGQVAEAFDQGGGDAAAA